MFGKRVLWCFAVWGLVACSEGDTGSITGRIAMKGAAIHAYLVIEDPQNHQILKLNNYRAFHLEKRQNEIVTLKVKYIKAASGPGFPAEAEVVEVL